MKPVRRYLALVPVCACLTLSSFGAVLQEAPTLQEVNNAMQAQDYVQVEDLCRQIVKEDASVAQAWFLLGYSLHAQGELDEAILVHITSTAFPQTAPLAYYNLGCAHALQGNPDQAFKALGKAVDLGVANAQQYQGDTDLESLRGDKRWQSLMNKIQPQLTAQSEKASEAKAKAKAKAKSKSKSEYGSTGVAAKDALHFWVGDWDCYWLKTGKLVGHNTLKFRVGKHVIHESWESITDGSTGESWNHFDPISKAWKQTWLGSGGDVTEFTADTKSDAEGVMFVGKSHRPGATGEPPLHRMHVRPIGNGRVQQTGSESADGGATWTIRYNLIYVPKGEAFELEDMSI